MLEEYNLERLEGLRGALNGLGSRSAAREQPKDHHIRVPQPRLPNRPQRVAAMSNRWPHVREHDGRRGHGDDGVDLTCEIPAAVTAV